MAETVPETNYVLLEKNTGFKLFMIKGLFSKMEITQEIQDLFELARLKLGAGVRKVEVTDAAMCACLELAMKYYNEQVLNFIIASNWSNFYGKKTMNNKELAFAFSTRTLDLSRDYSDYFSHIVGLQQHGTKWELKKDYFQIVPGQQCYTIPAGREVCSVMRFSVNTSDPAFINETFGAYGGGGSPMFQMGAGAAAAWAGNGFGYFLPFYAFSNFSVALSSMQMKELNSWLGAQVSYKITAGPENTHIVHLSNVPGGIFDRMGGFGKIPFQCFCWYTYYDVSPGEEDECASSNPDVYLSPDQIKLDMKHYWALNDAAKGTVTRLFIGEVAETLGLNRGKFSGNLQLLTSPIQMDYQMLLELGRREKENATAELKERLLYLSPYEVAKRDAELVENMKKIRSGTPLKPKVI